MSTFPNNKFKFTGAECTKPELALASTANLKPHDEDNVMTSPDLVAKVADSIAAYLVLAANEGFRDLLGRSDKSVLVDTQERIVNDLVDAAKEAMSHMYIRQAAVKKQVEVAYKLSGENWDKYVASIPRCRATDSRPMWVILKYLAYDFKWASRYVSERYSKSRLQYVFDLCEPLIFSLEFSGRHTLEHINESDLDPRFISTRDLSLFTFLDNPHFDVDPSGWDDDEEDVFM